MLGKEELERKIAEAKSWLLLPLSLEKRVYYQDVLKGYERQKAKMEERDD